MLVLRMSFATRAIFLAYSGSAAHVRARPSNLGASPRKSCGSGQCANASAINWRWAWFSVPVGSEYASNRPV